MKVIYKFLLRSFIGPLILSFLIVMFILIMHYLWLHIDSLVGKGLSMSVIVELMMYAAATLIPMGLPLAVLLASIMTMGALGENNELLAMKAAGMSLRRITRPLVVCMVFICIGSFYVINNLTPYSFQKMFSLLSDISKQRQEMKFSDGIFFNGIPDMSIRVSSQDPNTGLLHDVLIYDNSQRSQMRTTVADSGYINITPDKQYLEVILFHGQVYETNRNYEWFNNNQLSHHIFKQQNMIVPISGFALERSEMDLFASRSETKNIYELSRDIDSIRHSRDSLVNRFSNLMTKNYVYKSYTTYEHVDSILDLKPLSVNLPLLDTMGTEQRNTIYTTAKKLATDAQSFVKYESRFPSYAANMMYRAQADYQRKLALPFSIMIFFLIGSALGAIIRKGGLGMPIVISVVFFVIYYIISITGDKFVRDGAMHPFIGMWLSSLVLFPVAIFLTVKSNNDSSLFDINLYKAWLKRIWGYVMVVVRFLKIDKLIESISRKLWKRF